MKILICGASGLIGAALCTAFAKAGHETVRGVRHATRPGDIEIDYACDVDQNAWLPRLHGVDVVVNAVGIIVERGDERFDDIHRRAPQALFAACAAASVRRVVQISALGAERGTSRYFRSKRAADEFLTTLPLEWQIVRPALVYSEKGASACLFTVLASLPLHILPAGGKQQLQPIHLDDLTAAIVRLVSAVEPPGQCIELVGPNPVRYREMLAGYRHAMGFSEAPRIAVPAPLIAMAAECVGRLTSGLLNRESWQMLQAGNVGDPSDTCRILGAPPRSLSQFITAENAACVRGRALATWRLALLRYALAAVWIASAGVSAFIFPVDGSLALLSRVGLAGMPALITLYGAAALDFLLGVACLRFPGRRLWLCQLGLIVGYTAFIAWALPEFLWHPFGPVLKNLPIIAILFILWAEESKP
jgi:uncharacterized protein YbjT (DUF2867 family)